MKTIFAWLISLMFLGSGLAYAGTYTDSAHGQNINRFGLTGDSRYNPAGGGYGTGNCAHCHEAHASLDGVEPLPGSDPDPDQALLFSEEESVCEACHDGTGPAADNIQTQIDKDLTGSAHPTDNNVSVIHKVSESTTANMDPDDYSDTQGNRHAECVDCHNPHTAGSTVHTLKTNAVGATSPLYKVSGVSPPVTAAWATPSAVAYTEKPTSTGISYEYELCFKCHSNWTTQPGTQTNIAMQFNTANPSAHPVEKTLTNSSSSPLTAAQMNLTPVDWRTNVGNQTMYCSDCHGSETSGDPAGPHGSDNPKILKGRWPANSDTVEYLWDLDDAEDGTNSFNTECLCKKCHPIYPWQNEAHSTSDHSGTYKCVACHVGVPHGSNFGRLIADSGLGHPYDYNNNSARNSSFTKIGDAENPLTDYSYSDCNNGCSGKH